MKLLLDQNLSPRLVARLADVFPESNHVFLLGLDEASDREVWEYARDHDFTIVTKDADFGELSVLLGFPPKLLWLRLGNCTTAEVEALLRSQQDAIKQMREATDEGILVLG